MAGEKHDTLGKKEEKIVKKLTEKKVKRCLEEYFSSRRVAKRDQDGSLLVAKTGEILFEERPCTVTGLVLALGLSRREDLEKIKEKKVKALIDRALMRIEESAEEKLFSKDTVNGAKLFLSTNFKRWQQGSEEEEIPAGLGICTLWAE